MTHTDRDIERFWSHVDKSGECWVWVACRRPLRNGLPGYGLFQVKVAGKWKCFGAHRFSYELSTGESPGRLFVLHKCDNMACVRPEHLFLGTQQDNMDDMFSKGRRDRRKPYQKKEFRKAIKLSHEQYLEILEALKTPYWGQVNDLAAKYGVSHSAISIIKTGRWKPAAVSTHQ